jgi:MFS family permease
MSILAIFGFILAIINPVIGGVLVGYLVWLDEPDTGFQILMLSFFMFSLFVIGFIVWAQRKIKKLEREIKAIQGKAK